MKNYIAKIVECNIGTGEGEEVKFNENDNLKKVLDDINAHIEAYYYFITNKGNEELYGGLIAKKESLTLNEFKELIAKDNTIDLAIDPTDYDRGIYIRIIEEK